MNFSLTHSKHEEGGLIHSLHHSDPHTHDTFQVPDLPTLVNHPQHFRQNSGGQQEPGIAGYMRFINGKLLQRPAEKQRDEVTVGRRQKQ